MPSLLQRLKTPHPWLAVVLLAAGLGLADSRRVAGHQVTAKSYVAVVRGYQRLASPVLSRWIRCRYRPSCSDYSVEAVRRYGILKGLELTFRRVSSSTRAVTPGTPDPLL